MATVSCGTTSERLEFIQIYRQIGVKRLYKWLDLSRYGFYALKNRDESEHRCEDRELLKVITQIFIQSEGRYGSPRTHKSLLNKEINVVRKRVERLMREGVVVK